MILKIRTRSAILQQKSLSKRITNKGRALDHLNTKITKTMNMKIGKIIDKDGICNRISIETKMVNQGKNILLNRLNRMWKE